MYELKLEKFSGPLEKLLELIEARKLEVTEISLAQVTDDFLRYLRSLTVARDTRINAEVHLRMMADFIAIASRLILIKSKTLLPDLTLTQDEEADIKDLERRLKIYRELKPTLGILDQLWRNKKREFSRPYFLEKGLIVGGTEIFYPGDKLELKAMIEALDRIFESFKKFQLDTETITEKIVTIEEKIAEIVKRLENEREAKFTHLSSSKTRSEVIAIFLAILHLAREQLIFLEQTSHFSDIIIKRQKANSPEAEQARHGAGE